MVDLTAIKEHMEVIGADGVHVGTVDHVEGSRIKLTKRDSGVGAHKGHHHYLSIGLVAGIEGNKVRLAANAANALMFEEEQDGSAPSSKEKVAAPKKPGLNWNAIGLGVSALTATAGAVLLARRAVRSQDDFKLLLQTDENPRLISSSKVEGTPVIGLNGERLGKIESFMVDKYTGRVAYAVLSFGGPLGFGDSYFPLPWSALNYDVSKDGYVLNITKEQVARAPKFKASEAPEFDASYRRTVMSFYSRSVA